jgi:hypothetical protein
MTQDPNTLDCLRFQAQLAGLIGTGQNIADHPHLQNCALCRALLADLETIAEAPDELWEHIESAIKDEEASPHPN